MTRSDLVEELAARFSQLTHRDAEFAVKTLLDAMGEALVRGHRIELRGFGSFRSTVGPLAWDAIRVPARVSRFQKNVYPTSSQAKPCAKR